MKKVLQTEIIISMLLLSLATFGQTQLSKSNNVNDGRNNPKTYLDLMVNIANTTLNYGDANSSLDGYKKSNNGVQAGASFQAGITPSFSLVSELYFMRKGGKLKVNNPLTISESTLHLNTLELPVLARFHFGNFYANAGPSIAYTLSGDWKIADKSTNLSFNNTNDGYKRFDAGIQVGGGFELPFKQKRISLDIRYNYGLTNISYGSELYNRALMISVHYSRQWKKNPLARSY